MNLDELRAKHKDDILRIAAQYGLENIRVFGSVARGDAGPDSDLDLLVTLGKPLGFRFFRCRRELEHAIGQPVDLVPEDALGKHVGPVIHSEAQPL